MASEVRLEQSRNRYVVIPPRSRIEIPWNPYDPAELPVPDCAYIRGVLIAMEKHSSIDGLTFYITSDLQRLPSYGDTVVAIVLADEWCRVPRYAYDVRMIFKTYGTQLPIYWGAIARPSMYRLAALAQDLRTAVRRIPSIVAVLGRYIRRRVQGQRAPWRIHDLPLGFYRQVELPFVGINGRAYDVFFAGSVSNRGTATPPMARITPKFLSRAAMLARLKALQKRRPDLAISTSLTGGFLQTTSDDATRYSQTMMETKICLVPRGTSLETYRYFEGLRFGCVVVTERLPDRSFYRGSPAIRVRDWSDLDRIVPALLADHVKLEALSRESLSWWQSYCSEEAIGRFISERLAPAGNDGKPGFS